jgi:hypothetical protein
MAATVLSGAEAQAQSVADIKAATHKDSALFVL